MNSLYRICTYTLILCLFTVVKFCLYYILVLALRPDDLTLLRTEPVAALSVLVPLITGLVADVKVVLVDNITHGRQIRLGSATFGWILQYAKYFMLTLFPLIIVGVIYDATGAQLGYAWFERQVLWPVFMAVLVQTLFVACILLPIEIRKNPDHDSKRND